MRRPTVASFCALIATIWVASFGCELIAVVDRSQIAGSGGAGTTATTASTGNPTSTSTSTGSTGGMGGGGMPCTTVQDCPPPAGECVTATCDTGMCGTKNVAAGTKTATQPPGDCKQNQCDGDGAIVAANDDTDVPDDSNACTDDVCTSGVASHANVVNGSSCGGVLTCLNGTCSGCSQPSQCPGVDDECKARTCVAAACGVDFTASGTAVSMQTAGDCQKKQCDGAGHTVSVADDGDVPADDGNACTNDVCTAGVPSHPAKANNTACTDGNACTQSDTCQAGACTSGAPVTCTALDPCHVAGTCNPATGACSNPSKADGTACNDGDACTQSDTCQAGACTGANPVTCAALDPCHAVGTCDPASGVCSNPNQADGSACSDGDACTQSDTCQAGTCTGVSPVTCTALDPCHVAGTCDPATGACSNPNQADGTACNDGDACTQADTCQAGVCGGTAYTCTPTSCQQSATCDGNGGCTVVNTSSGISCPDDGDPCTLDTCDGAGTCWHVGAHNGASCGSALVCDLGSCVSGCFISGTFYAAGTGNPANACQVCTPASSTSTWSTGADGTACLLGACGAGSCIYDPIAYVKASNTRANSLFGNSVALSGDGNTLAVGANEEASNATGINGNQADNSAANAGAVYVFTRSGGTWSQQAYIKASNTDTYGHFGNSVALSGDGNTLAVGAIGERSNAMGINGNQADNSAIGAGAVYVFTRSGGTWSQEAYVKASNTDGGDNFGVSVALSGDGNTLAVGATFEASNATGINGNQADNSTDSAGAVYVFTRSGGTWSQDAYVKASNTDLGDSFGASVALSGNGNTLAVGATFERSNATGINGNQANNSAGLAGAVYVFTRSGGTWSQEAYVKASNTGVGDRFGVVALSGDGNTLAVGAYTEASNATGINGNQADNSTDSAGAVYVFTRSGGTWSQEAYVKASNTDAGDTFGVSVALSGDGYTLAVGAYTEFSNATGINGNQADNSAPGAGAVYVFTRSGGTWSQEAYVKASNTGAQDDFGIGVALSGDGYTLAVGANNEASNATGINGNQADNSAARAGAVYVY